MKDEDFQAWQRQKYEAALSALTPGNRDANLVTLALHGRQAGIDSQELLDDIMARAPGETRPNYTAVRRAVEHAARTVALGGDGAASDKIAQFRREPSAAEKRETERRALPLEMRQTVSQMIEAGRGTTSKDLIVLSPTPIPDTPQEQAALHLRTIGADWRWPMWAGTINATSKRGAICDPFALAATINTGMLEIPTHISLNPLTGREGRTKEGKPSYDCADTVAAFPFALLEFDALPLPDQCALAASLIREWPGRVVSIVYSGGKSLHTVVLVSEYHDRRVYTKPADIPMREDADARDEQKWRDNMAALRRRFASSDNPAERIDLAPTLNPAIHTRLAGAWRADKRQRQHLLYLDLDLAIRRLEIF